ncbi:MAG: hypothetical protein H0U23_04015 [Blastocatellia bacterium]|nr:hypothetical protein [Blastocatellia bacterium]
MQTTLEERDQQVGESNLPVKKIHLTPEQVKELCTNTKATVDGKMIVELYDDNKLIGVIKAGGYTYTGDTCCVKWPH